MICGSILVILFLGATWRYDSQNTQMAEQVNALLENVRTQVRQSVHAL